MLPLPPKGYRARTDFGKFWKIMEIDNAIIQDLESSGQGTFFKMAMEKFKIFIWENSTISRNGCKFVL